MTSFYEKAIHDDELAHFFRDEIGDDLSDEEWIEHIELLADFWLAKMLGEDTYYGNFVMSRCPISRERVMQDGWNCFHRPQMKPICPRQPNALRRKPLNWSKSSLPVQKRSDTTDIRSICFE